MKKYIALSAFLLGTSYLHSSDILDNNFNHSFSHLSYNIDTNIARSEGGYSKKTHSEWRANARAQSVMQTVNDIVGQNSVDLVHIQEGRKFEIDGELVDSVTPLKENFESIGLVPLVRSYNDAGGDKAFQFTTAYNPEKFELITSYMKFLTKTSDAATVREGKTLDEIKDHNFGAEWERGVFINEFKHIESGDTLISINVHLDIIPNTKLNSCKKIAEFTQDILKNQPNAKFIVTGDFNTFSDSVADEQLELVKGNVDEPLFVEGTDKLLLPNGAPAPYTFISFPYDFMADGKPVFKTRELEAIEDISVRKETINNFYTDHCQATSGILDRVLTRGFTETSCVVNPYSLFESLTDYTDKEIKALVVSHLQDGPAFASDHQPVITTVKW